MKLNPWDLAAAALIASEAGAVVSRFDGSPFILDRGEILASNGRIHDEMVAVLTRGRPR